MGIVRTLTFEFNIPMTHSYKPVITPVSSLDDVWIVKQIPERDDANVSKSLVGGKIIK